MVKFNCYNCGKTKKDKYFPKSQPYENQKVCDKCIEKHDKKDEAMIKDLEKRLKAPLAPQEKLNVMLSFGTIKEMKEQLRENPDVEKIFKRLINSSNLNDNIESLSKLDLSKSAVNELANHFTTVANINKKIYIMHQEKNDKDKEENKDADENKEIGDNLSIQEIMKFRYDMKK